MTFKEVLQQVIDWLEQDGRLSYRALKRQFDVDDEYLEDLKEELIYSKRLAVDEDGRVLVWTGGAETISVSEPLSPAPDAQEGPRTSTATESAAPAPEAERRQLTVMFCDLVGSTQLSAQLDPEDLREVVQTYQQTAAAAITRYDGYIAQYLGDGLLVYFGYPRAHEDDAQRAVRASLDLLDALGPLNIQLAQTQRVQLAVRIGIHTGQVVVGNIGGGERQELLALGETPNIAARLEGLAAPNQILISASTRRLVGQAFALEDLGLHTLKGVADPLQVYGIAGELVGARRVEASTLTLTPLVGREEEIGLLLRRWNQAKAGEGQVVLLSGEPGIGKSRTLQAMVECIANEPHLLMRFQCSPYHTNTAFYPITEQFAVAAGFTRHASAAVCGGAFDSDW
jgi:class 3 adenylate cyclase